MSRGVNKTIIIGHLGDDPSVRYMPTGGAVANITVATSESWTDKQTNEKREETEWHKVVFYGRLAEIVGEYLRKGSKVYLEGKLKTRKWQDQQGIDRYTTEIIANEMQMLDGKQDGQQKTQQQPQGGQGFKQQPQRAAPQPQQQHAMSRPAPQPQQNYGQPAAGVVDFDQDVPF